MPGVPLMRGGAWLDRILAGIDVVHLHQPWCPWLTQLGLSCLSRGIPYVVSLHGMLDRWSMSQGAAKKRLHLALAGRRMLQGASCVHFTAEDERRQAEDWFTPARCAVVPCVVDLAPYAERPDPVAAIARFGLPAGRRRLLFLSRIHPKKGLLQAVRALPAVRLACDVELCVAGDRQDKAYAAQVEREAVALGVEGHVRWLGHVDGSLKRSLYAAADALVLPTSQENFGLVLFESILCGTPIVTTRGVDGWRELESSGACWMSGAKPEEIGQAVHSLLSTDATESARRAEGARRWALGYLAEESVGGAMEAMYESARRGARPR
jgi:glycosyltransferase involved in cell wall biosynthesis